MKKKILIAVMSTALLFGLSACSSKMDPNNPKSIVTAAQKAMEKRESYEFWGEWVREYAGDGFQYFEYQEREGAFVEKPMQMMLQITQQTSEMEEPYTDTFYVEEEDKVHTLYYTEEETGWIRQEITLEQAKAELMDQKEMVELFLKEATEINLVDTEMVDGKEAYIIEMVAGPNVFAQLAFADTENYPEELLDQYLPQSGNVTLQLMCTEDGFLQYGINYTENYENIANAIQADENVSDALEQYATAYVNWTQYFIIRHSNVNGLASIEKPEGVSEAKTMEEVWEIQQRTMDQITPDDVEVEGYDGAAEIYLDYPDGSQELIGIIPGSGGDNEDPAEQEGQDGNEQ